MGCRVFVLFIKKKVTLTNRGIFRSFTFPSKTLTLLIQTLFTASHRLSVITRQSKFYIKIGRVVKTYQIHEITLNFEKLESFRRQYLLKYSYFFFSLQSLKAFLGISKNRKTKILSCCCCLSAYRVDQNQNTGS